MKTLWALSATILSIGACVLAYSYFPETVEQPYTTWVDQPRNTVLIDETVEAYRIYYDEYRTLRQGDRVSIVASSSDHTLTATVADCSNILDPSVISSQENVANISLDVTIPSSGYYEIVISRYRDSQYIIFLDKTNANVRVTRRTTERVSIQAYRYVTTYPHKDLQTLAIAILIAGIGVGVLTIAQGTRNKKQPTCTQPNNLEQPR